MFAKNIYLIYALDFHTKYIFLYIKYIYFIYIKYIWQFYLCLYRSLTVMSTISGRVLIVFYMWKEKNLRRLTFRPI